MDLISNTATAAARIAAAKREWRDAVKRYGRHDLVTVGYLQELRELAALVIGGAI